MEKTYLRTAKKLQAAINKRFGVIILLNSSQWYSQEKKMAITSYTIREQRWNAEKGKFTNIELFKTYSQVQLVLFLRDYWYKLNNWEIPTNNERWEELKHEYEQTSQPSDEEPKSNEKQKIHE